MKHIFDSSFRYRPSFATDVRKTFEAARRRQRENARDRDPAKANPDPQGKVLKLDPRKKAAAT